MEWSSGRALQKANYIIRLQNTSYENLPFLSKNANHVACLIERLRRNWFNTVGRSTTGATKARNALNKLQLDKPLITDDAKLLELLEELGLDDVASDLDLIAVKKWETNARTNSIWAFCFSPDDIDHFLHNTKITPDQMCYGRNGDNSLV